MGLLTAYVGNRTPVLKTIETSYDCMRLHWRHQTINRTFRAIINLPRDEDKWRTIYDRPSPASTSVCVKGVIFYISDVLLRPLKRDKQRQFKRRNDYRIKMRVMLCFTHHRKSDPRRVFPARCLLNEYRIFCAKCYFRWLTEGES